MQTAQTHIVDDLLDLLHIVLERIEALAQAVVLQVQQPEAGVQVGDKVRDVQRPPEVAQRHRVGGEARQLGHQLQQPHQVVLDVQMEAVALVDFHCAQEEVLLCGWAWLAQVFTRLTAQALADGVPADQDARLQVHGQRDLVDHALRQEVPLVAVPGCVGGQRRA